MAAGGWGLGPIFIADRCSAGHVGGGRNAPPAQASEQLTSMLVRISVPGKDEHGAPNIVPHYGDQLQKQALQGQSFECSIPRSWCPLKPMSIWIGSSSA